MRATAWIIVAIILAIIVAAIIIIFAIKGFKVGGNQTTSLWNLTNVSLGG